jgi:hypothetical protein
MGGAFRTGVKTTTGKSGSSFQGRTITARLGNRMGVRAGVSAPEFNTADTLTDHMAVPMESGPGTGHGGLGRGDNRV